jgi:predicted nucleic acid-binding protein
MALRAYFDTNVFCRPFDDQTQGEIRAETEAILQLLRFASERRIILVGSDLLLFEAGRLRNREKREGALGAMRQCHTVATAVPIHLELAAALEAHSPLYGRDALHVAIAALEGARYFVTCDRDIVRVADAVQAILDRRGQATAILTPAGILALLV